MVGVDVTKNTRINVDMSGKNNFGTGASWHKRY
jgi:hypothetical protein